MPAPKPKAKRTVKTKTVKGSEVKSRDLLMVQLINGATKAGTHKDARKEADRAACRKWKPNKDD